METIGFVRGDRVVTKDGVRGVVEDFVWDDVLSKGTVLVMFGTDRGMEFRDWLSQLDVVLEPEVIVQLGEKGTAQRVVVWPGTSDGRG